MSEESVKRAASSVVGINHIGLSVSNLDASLAFYTKGTGGGYRALKEKDKPKRRAGRWTKQYGASPRSINVPKRLPRSDRI